MSSTGVLTFDFIFRTTYSLTTLNCNTFCNAVITYLRPSNRELGRNRLNQIFEETDKTVQDVKETAVAVVDQAGQMIKTVAGVALGSGLFSLDLPHLGSI